MRNLNIHPEYKGKVEDYYLFTYKVDKVIEMMRVKEYGKKNYKLSLGSGEDRTKMIIEKGSNLGLDILSSIKKYEENEL